MSSGMSSGDLIADRRLEVALALRAEGDLDGAVSVFEQTIERAPDWPHARFALAEALEAMGRRDEAVAAYAAYLALDDADVMGATIRLSLLGAAPMPTRLPDAYVVALFDQYAPRFEQSLVGRLSYDAPFRLRDAVEAVAPFDPNGHPAEARVLDLGCGTGLAGEAFRARASWLEGVDLSAAMVAEARRKGVYDRVEVGDAIGYLQSCRNRFDLITAADVVVYLGDLAPLLGVAAAALAAGGLLAFSAQKAPAGDFLLGADHRYSHGADYLRRVATEHGFTVAHLADAVCRTEGGQGVLGLIAVLEKPALRPDEAVAVPGCDSGADRWAARPRRRSE